jgi:hypothetical protein
VPTARNGQAAGFYPDRGFTASGDAFVLDPAEEAPPMPDEMTIKVNTNA